MTTPGQLLPPVNNSLPQNAPTGAHINTPANLPPPPVTPTQVTPQNGPLPAAQNTPPVVQTKVPKSEFKRLTNEWKETHEKLTGNFRELNIIFADIKFLLQQLESQLAAAGIKSDLSHCVAAANSCIESFTNANANASSLDMHINNLDKNVLNNAPQDIQESFKKLTEKVAEAGKVGRAIGVPGVMQNTSATQPTQSAQPLLPSQSNQDQIQQTQKFIQTSSNNLQRHLGEIDRLEKELEKPFHNGSAVDVKWNTLKGWINPASSDLDKCERSIRNALNNFQQALQNNQPQAQAAWAQVKTDQAKIILHVEGQLQVMSDEIDKIEPLISSITSDLLNFPPKLTVTSNSFNVFKADFAQKSSDFSNLSQQMNISVLSQNDSQQLLQAQQGMQSVASYENTASQRIQSLNSNYQLMQTNLAAHMRNRDYLRQSHKALVAKVKKIKDDLINNP
jgi:chromosome segregation ATPase